MTPLNELNVEGLLRSYSSEPTMCHSRRIIGHWAHPAKSLMIRQLRMPTNRLRPIRLPSVATR